MTHLSRRAARLDNRLFLPQRTLVGNGARYRFKLAEGDATLCARMTTLFDVCDFDLRGAGAFDLIPGRVAFFERQFLQPRWAPIEIGLEVVV